MDWDQVCRNNDDPRRLPADTIKRIAAYKGLHIGPTGIRIIGAVFCSDPSIARGRPPFEQIGLDLAGLNLEYSLILDRSVVNGTVDARNLRVKGDLVSTTPFFDPTSGSIAHG
jgi:hypothetical protein